MLDGCGGFKMSDEETKEWRSAVEDTIIELEKRIRKLEEGSKRNVSTK